MPAFSSATPHPRTVPSGRWEGQRGVVSNFLNQHSQISLLLTHPVNPCVAEGLLSLTQDPTLAVYSFPFYVSMTETLLKASW